MNLIEALSAELESLAAKAAPAVVSVEDRRGQGTGLALAPDGYVLTNAHVVRSRRGLVVRLGDGTDVDGDLLGADARTDLAVVRVRSGVLPTLPFADSRNLKVGQLVLAIGYPLRFERSVSLGVVSAFDRALPLPRGGLLEGLIQTDAAINPGNSGGPLLDATGSVVGINTAIIPFAQGIGFAVPAHTVTWVASVLMRQGEVQRPFLGIAARGEDLGGEASRAAGRGRGVRVHRVNRGTPADVAGLRDQDVLLSANGNPVTSVDDLQRAMVLSGASELRLEILRRGERLTVTARPAMQARAA